MARALIGLRRVLLLIAMIVVVLFNTGSRDIWPFIVVILIVGAVAADGCRKCGAPWIFAGLRKSEAWFDPFYVPQKCPFCEEGV